MENKVNNPVKEIEDILFAAFLAYRGHAVTPCKQPDGKFLFEVIGDLSGDIDLFHRNAEVGVRIYGSILQDLEGQKENLRK